MKYIAEFFISQEGISFKPFHKLPLPGFFRQVQTCHSLITSKHIYINVHGKPVQLNELEILSNGIRALAYSLYSNEQFSTGNFAKFRLLRKDRKIWYHYQMVTSEYPDRQSAQKRVESFLNTFAIEPESPTEK